MANFIQMTLGLLPEKQFQTQTAGHSERHVRISALPDCAKDYPVTDQVLLAKFSESLKKGKSGNPNGLSMKMLKECFLQTGEETSSIFSLKWTDSGTMLNGRISTPLGTSHKTGSGFMLSDILENSAGGGILPVEENDGQTGISVIAHRNGYRRNTQVYDPTGITETLDTCGGGREPHVAIPIKCGLKSGIEGETELCSTLLARDGKGFGSFGQTAVAVPVLTPEREDKRQNGRRFKENGEPMFTLTAQDRHGVVVNYNGERDVYAVWSDKYQCYIAIRKLTPRECFRLQGWTDDYFDKAVFVNTDTQLYKQAGNGVTVQCAEAIGNLFNKRKEV